MVGKVPAQGTERARDCAHARAKRVVGSNRKLIGTDLTTSMTIARDVMVCMCESSQSHRCSITL